MIPLTGNITPLYEAAGREIRPAAFARARGGFKSGFTLVEVLVVTVIIAVLGAAGTVAYQNSMVAANRAKCASNMRQLGIGLISHAQENHGRLPATQHGSAPGSTDTWVFAVKNSFGEDVHDPFICPADPHGEKRARQDASSYIMNSFLDSGATDPFGRPLRGRGNINTINDPARTMMLFIVAEHKGVHASNDHVHAAGWSNWPRVLADIQPDRHRRGQPAADHSIGSANYLYVDGHVRSIPASDFKREIERGNNPTVPPR